MMLRSLFNLGLLALMAALHFLTPASLLPCDRLCEAFSAAVDGAAAGFLQYDAPADFDGSVAVWNDSGARLFSASVTWETGTQGSSLADGSPIGRYRSFVLDPALAGVQQVTLSVQTDMGELSSVFTHDFSRAPLVVAVRGGEYAEPLRLVAVSP